VIIFGWARKAIVLALKRDLCPKCGQVGNHAILRATTWVELFWIPVLPIWISHRLMCLGCGADRPLGWRRVRAALKTGRLPLDARPGFRDYARAQFEEVGRSPQESELDPIQVNPKRGPWDVWLKAWPVVVTALVILSVVTARPTAAVPAAPIAAAHTCWLDTDGSISGCRLGSGAIDGYAIGRETTCFFTEPLPTGGYTVRCRDRSSPSPAATG
jgi:hypothetical protein